VKNFKVDQVDEIVHGRVRLGAMAYLSAQGKADFTELRDALDTAEGALSVHLRKLEAAGYVTIKKAFAGRKPRTTITLTASGRSAYEAYLETLQSLLSVKF
jgi:DNA-binding MarR family transcriptional regulator